LHFASFHGNLKAVRYLIENGADFTMTNKHKINMMHVAAQGDNPLSLYYFYKLGLDINACDRKLSTPLHWAAYSG
jgi:ankyrin repeat protein